MLPRLIAIASMTMMLCLLSACETTDSGTVTEQSGASSVPGEKVTSGTTVMPNATSGVPGASVGW